MDPGQLRLNHLVVSDRAGFAEARAGDCDGIDATRLKYGIAKGMPRIDRVATQLQRAALLTFAASLIFWAFFQIGKSPNFVTANPFANDPVDAIGSIAVQVALAVSILTLARAAQVGHAPTASTYKRRLIVRGNSVALLAIGVTLVADTFMELQYPTWDTSIWGQLLVVGLGTMALITCAAGLATVAAARRLSATPTSEGPPIGEAGSLGEALGDLWALVRKILAWFGRNFPRLSRPLRWIDNLGNLLFEWMMNWPWIGPRSHPWRFCASVALALGVALATGHGLEEGPSFNLTMTVLVWSIFIVVELAAGLLGFLLLGGFLGLRPPLRSRRE